MTATLLPPGRQQYESIAGLPLVGGKIYTYLAGTSTPAPTWQDANQVATNTNPVILDARGEASIFWNGAYKIVLKDALDNTIWTQDNCVAADLPVLLSAYVKITALASTTNPSGASMIGNLGGGTVQDVIFVKGAQAPTAHSIAAVLYKIESATTTAENFGGYWTYNTYFDHVINKEWTVANSPVGAPDASPATTFAAIAINGGSQADVVAEMAIVKATASNTASFGRNAIVTSSVGLTGLKVVGDEIDMIVPVGSTVSSGGGLYINFFNVHYPGAAIIIGNGGFPGGYTDIALLVQQGIGPTGTILAVSAFTVGVGIDFSQCTFSTMGILMGTGISHGIEFGNAGGGTSPIVYGDAGGNILFQLGATNLFAIKDKTGATNLLTVDGSGNVDISAGTGTVFFNAATSAATANAGGATLPANPVGFLTVKIAGTVRKLPYYAT